jgi:hypothetical protein
MATRNAKPESEAVSGKKPVGKHLQVMKRAIKKRQVDPVKAEMLKGLARAWDEIEATGQYIPTIPGISKEIREIWDSLGNPEDDITALWT